MQNKGPYPMLGKIYFNLVTIMGVSKSLVCTISEKLCV